MTYFIKCVTSHYANFSGRAGRVEFWNFVLFYVLLTIIIAAIIGIFRLPLRLGYIWSVVMLIPSLAVTVRRLHDINRSGWWVLITLVPVIGWIVLLIFMVTRGSR